MDPAAAPVVLAAPAHLPALALLTGLCWGFGVLPRSTRGARVEIGRLKQNAVSRRGACDRRLGQRGSRKSLRIRFSNVFMMAMVEGEVTANGGRLFAGNLTPATASAS